MVGVYLALGVLMALRLAGLKASPTSAAVGPGFSPASRSWAGLQPAKSIAGPGFSPAIEWALIIFLALDYLNAPVPLTALDRPALYERLASVDEGSPVIEVPFGIGDGLSIGIGAQNRRILYYATIHVIRSSADSSAACRQGWRRPTRRMPIVGNLLRLSSGQPAVDDESGARCAVPLSRAGHESGVARAIAYVHNALESST